MRVDEWAAVLQIQEITCPVFTALKNCGHIVSSRKFLGRGKAIPVTGLGDPYGCETSRLPHFLDNRLTDGGKVVSLTRWPAFTPRKMPGTHFC
jgi:hypothetical protein